MNLFKKLLWLLLAATMLMGVVSCSDDDDDDDDPKLSVTLKAGSTAIDGKTEVTVKVGDTLNVEITNPTTKKTGETVSANPVQWKSNVKGDTWHDLEGQSYADSKVTGTIEVPAGALGKDDADNVVTITFKQSGRSNKSFGKIKVTKKTGDDEGDKGDEGDEGDTSKGSITLTATEASKGTFNATNKTLTLSAEGDSVFTLAAKDKDGNAVTDVSFAVSGTDDKATISGTTLTIKKDHAAGNVTITATKEGAEFNNYVLAVTAAPEPEKKNITKVEIIPNKAITLGTGEGSSIAASTKTDVTSKAGTADAPTAVTITEATDIVFATTGATGDTATFSYAVEKGGDDDLPEGLAFDTDNTAKLSLPAASAVVKVTISATGYNSVDVYLAITYEEPMTKLAESTTTTPKYTLTANSTNWQVVFSGTSDVYGAKGTLDAGSKEGDYKLTITDVLEHNTTTSATTPGAARKVDNGVEKTEFTVAVTAGVSGAAGTLGDASLEDLTNMVASAFFKKDKLALYATPTALSYDDTNKKAQFTEGKSSTSLIGDDGSIADKAAKTGKIQVVKDDELALFITNQTNNKNEKCNSGKVTYSIVTPKSRADTTPAAATFATYTDFDTVADSAIAATTRSKLGTVKATITDSCTIKVVYEDGKTLSATAGSTDSKPITTGLKLEATIEVEVPKLTLTKADGTNDITVTNAGAKENLWGKTISDLVDGELTFTVEKVDGHDVIKVSGTLKNVSTAWTDFDPSGNNTGYFVPLWYTANDSTKIVFLDNSSKKALTGPGSKSIDLTAAKGDGQIIRVTKTESGADALDTSKTFLIGFGDPAADAKGVYSNYATLDFSGCTAAK